LNLNQFRYKKGFTLLELLIAIAIVAILVTLALPNKSNGITRTHINESIKLVELYKPVISASYYATGTFPKDNEAANIPSANKILGNYVSSVYLELGAFHLEFGNKIHPSLAGKTLSIRPIYVEGSQDSPVSWICGNDSVPDNMSAGGENKTDIGNEHLPLACR